MQREPDQHPDAPNPAAGPAGTLTITAPPGATGQRADRFLAEATQGLSRSRVKTLIQDGKVTRNGTVLADPAEAVKPGSRYALAIPPPAPATPQPQPIPFPILYEDADLIVLDKPPGLVVHPAPGNQDGTLVNALLAHCGDTLTGIGGERRPGIVHRLDKDTSGLMVVAKTQLANTALTQAFAARDLDRAYLALCWGIPAPLAGEIEAPIGRDPRNRKRMAVTPGKGRPALTHYRTLQAWNHWVALLECRLATGRTHQIRVHLSNKGHPLVGDPLYLRRIPAAAKGAPPPIRQKLLDFPRQALHAARLGFTHPRTGKTLSFQSDPPPDMQQLLAALAGHDENAIQANRPVT